MIGKADRKMRSLICCALIVALADFAAAEPAVIIDTDFGVPGKAFSNVNADKGNRITGSLPAGWSDNTGWKNKVVAEYKPTSEGERKFVRIEQASGDGLQFMHSLPGMEKEPGYYRLTFTARSTTDANCEIRVLGRPFSTLVPFAPIMDGQWHDFSYDFRLQRQSQPIGLFVHLASNGILDIQKLKLVKLSDQDMAAEIKAKYPNPSQGNLLNVSMFPLGLQSGWSIDREYSDGDQVQVSPDAKVPGPTGCPSLRIKAEKKGIRIYSAPFAVPQSYETHVLSMSARGSWSGKLVVTADKGQACATMPLSLAGEQWQRVELPFKPVMLSKMHALRLTGTGTLWLDGLQVERAAKATEYAPQKPMEVSLALPSSDADKARVQFDDEPAKINYAVVGNCPGAVLKTRLVTLYGDEKLLPAVKLPDQFQACGTIDYEPFNPHALGVYRLEAWAENASGERVSPFNEVVFYRLHRPRYWGKDAPNSFFGVHTLSVNRHLAMAKAIGCNWVRLHDSGTQYIGWSYLEPQKGQWVFRDEDLQRYRDHKLMILGLLSTTPGWASNLGRPAVEYFDRYLEPLNMDDWANAVRTIVGRYRGMIDSYEIWNEPWGDAFWGLTVDPKRGPNFRDQMVPSDTPAKDYARLQKVAYDAAHEVFPGVTIVGFNTCGAELGTKWTKDVLDSGGIDTCDAISYHDYEAKFTGFSGDNMEKTYQAAMGPIIEKFGLVTKPVWMSEGAPHSGDMSDGLYRYTLPYENVNDNWRIADRMARFVVTHKANGQAHEFLYSMHCHDTFGHDPKWTTLVTADGYLNPSAAAHSALAWLLEDTKPVKCVTLADGVYAYLFAGPGQAVAAITSGPRHAAYNLPAAQGVQLLDLFGNSLAPGTAIDGNVHYVVCDEGLEKLQAALAVK
jgi:hypothetical protein